MKVYCISYDLKGYKRDYSPLIASLQTMGKWWHFLDSTWLIATNLDPTAVWNTICRHVDSNDRILIIEVRNSKNGWLPKEAWDWINTNTPSS